MKISRHAKQYASKAMVAVDQRDPAQLVETDIAEAFEAGMRFERKLDRATDPYRARPAKGSDE
jgi:hypothetical protein